jgi:ribosomal protein S18 acetylase RimI-like enzyme
VHSRVLLTSDVLRTCHVLALRFVSWLCRDIGQEELSYRNTMQATMLRHVAPRPSSVEQQQQSSSTVLQQPLLEPRHQDLAPGSLNIGNASRNIEQTIQHAPAVHNPTGSLRQDTTISLVERHHLHAIRRLTSTTLPMRYPDKFYTELVDNKDVGQFCRVALFENSPVGWIRCRLEPKDHTTSGPGNATTYQLYIQALCILAPYRERGLATLLLEAVISMENMQKHACRSVYAHVWEQNEDALLWYEHRGFTRLLLVDGYYKRLRPSGAWLVRKNLSPC